MNKSSRNDSKQRQGRGRRQDSEKMCNIWGRFDQDREGSKMNSGRAHSPESCEHTSITRAATEGGRARLNEAQFAQGCFRLWDRLVWV